MGTSSHEPGTSGCHMLRLVVWLGTYALARLAEAQLAEPATISRQPGNWATCCVGLECSLQINQTCTGAYLGPSDENRFIIDTAAFSECGSGPDAQFVVELWHDLVINTTTGEPQEAQASPLLFLSRGFPPEVTWDNPATLPSFFPPLSDSLDVEYDPQQATPSGTFADLTAWRQNRRYHSVRVAHNAVDPYGTSRTARVEERRWHVVVANTGGWIGEQHGAQIPRYLLRAACYADPSSAPCPRNLVSGSECLGSGTCTRRAGRPAECKCDDSTGGYLCDTTATSLTLVSDPSNDAVFTTGRLNLLQPLPPGQWAHYKVQLAADVTQFLAELYRQNGSCLLVVKPEGSGEAPFDLPTLLDLQEFADVQSFINHAQGQARMLRRSPAAAPGAPPPPIFVSILSFAGAPVPGEDCDAELRVRALPAAAARAQRLCPFDCSGAGTCAVTAVAPGPSDFVDQTFPGEPADAEDAADVDALQTWLQVASQEVCACQEAPTPARGPWCEATQAEPRLEFGVWTEAVVLPPLQWRPHRVTINPARDTPLRLELQLGERQDRGWTEQGHAVCVARLGSRVPTATENDFLFLSRGGPGGALEFVIAREDLLEEAELTVAVLNAGLVPAADGSGVLEVAPGRSLDVQYRVRVTEVLPGQPLSRAEIVGIIIGCAAFMLIVFVLCIVICRQCRASLQGPEVELLPIGPRAVPAMSPGAIAELETFTYDEPGLAVKGVTEQQLRHASSAGGGAGVPPADAAAPPSCRICHGEYETGERLQRLPCQHIFHKECIDKWLGGYHATCPVCRMNLLGSFKSPRLSRMLASSGRAESANVSARRHLSGGYSGMAYMDSAASASSGGFDGDAPRWATGSGHYSAPSGHSAVPSLYGTAHLPRRSSASASPDRSPTPVQRVNSDAAGPVPGRSAYGHAAWAHDSGPEVTHHDHLRATGDTDGTMAALADFADTDSGRAAAVGAAEGETFRNSAYTGSRSSSPAPGDTPGAVHAPLPTHAHAPTAEYWGMVAGPGQQGPAAYKTAYPPREASSGGSGPALGMLGQSSMLPGESMLPGHSAPGVPGSPLGGPAVGNPALRGPPVALAASLREPSQDSLLNSDSGGSIGLGADDADAVPAPVPVGGIPLVQLGRDSYPGGPAGGGPSIASTVSPLDTAAAGGGPSIASTITPAQSRDGASASRTHETDDQFTLPVIGAAAWAAPVHGAGGGVHGAFPGLADPDRHGAGEARGSG